MSTPAPSAAATPAAVPVVPSTQATPPAAPAATPPDGDSKATGRGTRLFGLLAAEAEVPPGPKAEAKKPDAAAPATPAPDGKDAKPDASSAPASPPDEKPIRATKTKAIAKRPDLPTSTPAPVTATPAPASAAPADDDLIDEEKQLIDEATEAEKYLPGRKGLAEQTRKFVKAHAKFIETHPDIETDPDEKAAYDTFLRTNRPSLSSAEQRTITEGRIAANVSRPFEQKTAQLEHEIYVRDQEPVFRDQRQRVTSELNTAAIPNEIMEFAQKHGADVAKREFADELGVVNEIVGMAASDYDELIRLDTYNPKGGRPVSTPATDEKDPKYAQHQRLLQTVQKVDSDFKETAKQNELLRDGKWFVTREEWANLPPSERGNYWKFSNREVATRMLQWVKPAVEILISNRRQDFERRGYERRKYVPPSTPAPAAAAPIPVRTPGGPGASPVPAPTGVQPQATPASRLISALTAD